MAIRCTCDLTWPPFLICTRGPVSDVALTHQRSLAESCGKHNFFGCECAHTNAFESVSTGIFFLAQKHKKRTFPTRKKVPFLVSMCKVSGWLAHQNKTQFLPARRDVTYTTHTNNTKSTRTAPLPPIILLTPLFLS